MTQSAFGASETKYFFELTPDKILESVEEAGFRVTGRCLTLNSMENRVYDVELDIEDESKIKTKSERFRIAKFYRPGRWNKEQILEEHAFLKDLNDDEIPAVAPLPFKDGTTLRKMPDIDIWYSVFPKVGGRSPDELNHEQLPQIGRLLARLHNVGASKESKHRLQINPTTYGLQNLNYLLESNTLPLDIKSRYKAVVENICQHTMPWFEETSTQRIHGDCHLGNLIWGTEGPFWVDFDDMLRGPCVQDVWLIVPGRDQYAKQDLQMLLEGYEQMRDFDHNTLRLIEPLRALRFIHFSAWIARRWDDPAFPRAFPHFAEHRYWEEQVHDLEEQLRWIQKIQ